MTDAPLIDVSAVTKAYGGLRPLRVKQFQIGPADRIALSGLDAGAAETLINLITGASVADEGSVVVSGHDTRGIRTDTEWLSSLDRFGIVTHRAVLIGKLPIEQNLALPLTLAIDPMGDDTRAAVNDLADRVGLSRSRLTELASTLSPAEVVAVHLARALAAGPQFVILEHPTAPLNDRAASEALGRTLHQAVPSGTGGLAITEDTSFARASGATMLRLRPATGEITRERSWWRLGK